MIRKQTQLAAVQSAAGISLSNSREKARLFSTEQQFTSSATNSNSNHHAFNNFKGKRRPSSNLQEQGPRPRGERPLFLDIQMFDNWPYLLFTCFVILFSFAGDETAKKRRDSWATKGRPFLRVATRTLLARFLLPVGEYGYACGIGKQQRLRARER